MLSGHDWQCPSAFRYVRFGSTAALGQRQKSTKNGSFNTPKQLGIATATNQKQTYLRYALLPEMRFRGARATRRDSESARMKNSKPCLIELVLGTFG